MALQKGNPQDIISDEYRCNYPQQYIEKSNLIIYNKEDHTSWSSGIYLRDARMVQYLQIIHTDKLKAKNHNFLKRCRETFNRIQDPFMIKTLNKVITEGVYLKIIKSVYDKP